jgi:hypothetical protein
MSKVEQIFTLWQILEKAKEFSITIHHLILDFITAYDTVNRRQLYLVMEQLHIAKKLTTLVQITIRNT